MLAREQREREQDMARDRSDERARAAIDDEGARRAAEALESESLRRRSAREALIPSDQPPSDDGSSSDGTIGDVTVGDSSRRMSRYESDFKELEIVGRGGCGEVARSANRLDKRIYAVKKVRLDSDATRGEARRQLREVEALATVFHPHVVRYYQAWIEGILHEDDDESSDVETDDALSTTSDCIEDGSRCTLLTQMATNNCGIERVSACTLYIQMEFCPRTLRELIDSNALTGRLDDAWRLVRQIIEALAYLHTTCCIVHRDLKPANVFVDAAANVKVGDLGLATTIDRTDDESGEDNEEGHEPPQSLLEPSGGGEATDRSHEVSTTSLTHGVGTALYRAPEVMPGNGASKTSTKKHRATYDSSADMFSMGVVVYEIMHPPFDTAMERIDRLQVLRQGRPRFDEHVDTYTRALVARLVSNDPSKRPTAVALLEGEEVGLLPATADAIDGDSGLLSRAKSTIRNPFSRARAELIAALFDSETTAVSEFSYCRPASGATPGRPVVAKDSQPPPRRRRSLSTTLDDGSMTLLDAAPKLRSLTSIEHALRLIFESHGAISFSSPIVRPRPARRGSEDFGRDEPAIAAPSNQEYEVIDPAGLVVVLPSELTTPFARRVAAEPVWQRGVFRRYEIGRTFERGLAGPRERRAAAFDIVCFEPTKTAFSTPTVEAECLALVCALVPRASVVVGHADVASALDTLCEKDTDFAARHARLVRGDYTHEDPLKILDAVAAALQKIRRGDEAKDRAKRKLRGAVDDMRRILCVARDYAGMRWRGMDESLISKGVTNEMMSRLSNTGNVAEKIASVLRGAHTHIVHHTPAPYLGAAKKSHHQYPAANSAIELPRIVVVLTRSGCQQNRRWLPFGETGSFFGACTDVDEPAGHDARIGLSRRASTDDDSAFSYVAVGGRFDSAIARHIAPVDRANVQPSAVGIRFDIERLQAALSAQGRVLVSPGSFLPSQRAAHASSSVARKQVLCCSLERSEEGNCAALFVAATLRANGMQAAHLPRTSQGVGGKHERDSGKKGGDEFLTFSARSADWLVTLSVDTVEREVCTIVDVSNGYSPSSSRREVPLSVLCGASSFNDVFDTHTGGDRAGTRKLFDETRQLPGMPVDSHRKGNVRSFRLVRCADGDGITSSAIGNAANIGSKKEAHKRKIEFEVLCRRVVAALQPIVGTDISHDDRAATRCFAVNAPLCSVRQVTTAFVFGDTKATRAGVVTEDRTHKRELRYLGEALAEAFLSGPSGKLPVSHFAYVYAIPDNAIDLVFLPHAILSQASDADAAKSYEKGAEPQGPEAPSSAKKKNKKRLALR